MKDSIFITISGLMVFAYGYNMGKQNATIEMLDKFYELKEFREVHGKERMKGHEDEK